MKEKCANKNICYFSPPFVFQEKEEYRPRSSSSASGSGRGGGGRGGEYYGRQYSERGRERGGGRPENPPPPRRQDDWRCPEVNQQRLYSLFCSFLRAFIILYNWDLAYSAKRLLINCGKTPQMLEYIC